MNKQGERICQYIEKNGSIGPVEAFLYLGITKLATRISEMRRKDGMEFVKIRSKGINRFGEPVIYMRYSFPAEEKEA